MFDPTTVFGALILGLAGLAIPFLLSLRIFPIIIITVRAKNLMDEPGARSLHGNKVPTMGGVGIFISFCLTAIPLSLMAGLGEVELLKLLSVLASSMILFFLGVKDDLIALDPGKKIIGQVIAALLVIFLADIRIESFYGLLGLDTLPYWVSVMVTVLVFLVLINAYNLIDGIDGLAGTITLIICGSLVPFFLLNGEGLYLVLSATLIGSTVGFLLFNLSSKRRLFMGDTGSLFMGFLVAFLGISFLGSNHVSAVAVSSGPALLLAIFSFPILDTIRVCFIRIWNRKSLFKADRNHIHHRLLGLGMQHRQATSAIALMNLIIIATVLILNDLSMHEQVFIVLCLSPLCYSLPFAMGYAMGMASVKMPVDVPVITTTIMAEKQNTKFVNHTDTVRPFKNAVYVKEKHQLEKEKYPIEKVETFGSGRSRFLKKAVKTFKNYKSTN